MVHRKRKMAASGLDGEQYWNVGLEESAQNSATVARLPLPEVEVVAQMPTAISPASPITFSAHNNVIEITFDDDSDDGTDSELGLEGLGIGRDGFGGMDAVGKYDHYRRMVDRMSESMNRAIASCKIQMDADPLKKAHCGEVIRAWESAIAELQQFVEANFGTESPSAGPNAHYLFMTYLDDVIGFQYEMQKKFQEFNRIQLMQPTKFEEGMRFRGAEWETECMICYQPYKAGQMVRVLKCGHHTHKECGDLWFAVKVQCSYCRKEF